MRQTDSDSDSELSGMEGGGGDMDLASSHSSDDDDEEYPWSRAPKHKVLGKKQTPMVPGPLCIKSSLKNFSVLSNSALTASCILQF